MGVSDPQEKSNYAKYSDLAKMVELRVENVTFLSPDAAALDVPHLLRRQPVAGHHGSAVPAPRHA